LEILFKITRI